MVECVVTGRMIRRGKRIVNTYFKLNGDLLAGIFGGGWNAPGGGKWRRGGRGMVFKRRAVACDGFWVAGGMSVWGEWYWRVRGVSRHMPRITPHNTPQHPMNPPRKIKTMREM